MHIRDLIIERLGVTTASSDDTVTLALQKLKDSGFRCIPVVDQEDRYKGMIYKIHLIEFLYENEGDVNAPITPLIRHQEIYLTEDESFLNALLRIKSLPFISVVKDQKLIGILTHNQVESVLEDAFGLKTGGINITLASTEARGMIYRLTKTLRDDNIEGLLTLDNGSALARRVVITLENNKTDEEIQKLRDKLEKNGFRILQVSRLTGHSM